MHFILALCLVLVATPAAFAQLVEPEDRIKEGPPTPPIIREGKSAQTLNYMGGVPAPIPEQLQLIVDSQFNRPNSCRFLSSSDQVLFDTLTITNSGGAATMVMYISRQGDTNACGSASGESNTRMVLYRGNFDPADPLQNCSTVSVDETSGAPRFCPGIFFTMAPGEVVNLVITTNSNFQEATYQINWRNDTFPVELQTFTIE